MSGSVVIAERLGKDYREGFLMRKTTALKEVSFTLEPGVILGFLGPNGAGKSTTLHLLMGFIKASRGRATLFGRPPTDRESRRGVGFLPEVFAFDSFTTGRRLLRRFDALAGNSPEGREHRVDDALRAVGLMDAASRRVGAYSKGMTQRIGLAQALLGDPDLLILDEPMSGMDPATRHSVRDILRARRDRGKTTLFSSHILSDVEALADRVLFINHGRTVAEGSPAELTKPRPGCRIVFRHASPERFDALFRDLGLTSKPLEKAGDFEIELLQDAMKNVVLSRLVGEGAEVVSLVPRGAGLEELFLELMGSTPAGALSPEGPAT